MMKLSITTITRCLLLGALLLWPISHAQAAIWTVEDVVSSKYFEDFYPRAIAVEGSGTVHFVYGGKHLYYAVYDGSDWQYETIDTGTRVGRYASVALDSQNHIHIAYYDDHNDDLKYATNSSGTWAAQSLDQAGEVGRFASLTIDSNDQIHISYYDGSHSRLKYATNAAGSWSDETVDTSAGTGRYSSIAIDSNNRIYISYAEDTNHDLKVAWSDGSGWSTQTVDSNGEVGTFGSLAIDAGNTVHISYYDATNEHLKYAAGIPGSWTVEVVDDQSAGPHSSIDIDPNNHIHIGYHAETIEEKEKVVEGETTTVYVPYHTARYATNSSSAWETKDIEVSKTNDGKLGYFVSIAATASNDVHLSYLGDDDALRYAHYGIVLPNPSPQWRRQDVEERSIIGAATSLVKDQDDALHLACVNISTNQLVYINNGQGGWSEPEEVAPVGSGIRETSIAVDSNKKAHISYFGPSESLRYAKHYEDTSTIPALPWTLQPVDSVNPNDTLGRYSSMTIDTNDSLHIAYHNQTDGDLWYATNSSGTWNVEIVDDSGYAGKYPAITLDSSGHVHIAYLYEYFSINDTKNLQYATNSSGTWQVEIVDDSGFVGEYADLAIDSSDAIHISYFDLSNGKLKYALGSAGDWTIEAVDSEGYVGMFTSIAVDSNDDVHISYHGWDADFLLSCLRYANNPGGTWTHQTINSGSNVGTYSSLVIDSQDQVHIAYFDEANCIPRYARAVYLDVDVSPAAHDFGELRVGQHSNEREITIRNVGVTAQSINSIVLSDDTNFELDVNGGLMPCESTSPDLTVSQDTCTVTVTFAPTSATQHNATLNIDFGDPAVPDAAVTLTGKGTDGGGGGGGGGGCFISTIGFTSHSRNN